MAVRSRKHRDLRGYAQRTALVLALTCVTASVTHATANRWNWSGPPNADIWDLAVDPTTPTTVWSAPRGQVYKSVDAGATWTPRSDGLPGYVVLSLAISPSAPNTLYAGLDSDRVYKTTDAGVTWTPASTGLPASGADGDVNTLALTGTTLYAGTNVGVYKSTNAGGSWTAVNAGMGLQVVHTLAIDPTAPDTVYAGTQTGVYRTTTGGTSWIAASSGLSGTSLRVHTLVVNPATPSTVYAGTGSGAFKSTDWGATWTEMSTDIGATPRIDELIINPGLPSTLYAAGSHGVWKTTNSGGNWTEVSPPSSSGGYSFGALALNPAAPNTLYAAGSNPLEHSLFKSTNGGSTWTASDYGLASYPVRALAIDPSAPTVLYTGSAGFTQHKTTDGGASWTAMDITGGLDALAVDPLTPTTVYAGRSVAAGAVLKSTDAGETWNSFSGGLPPWVEILTLTVHPTIPNTLFAGHLGAGIYRSTDGGAIWTGVNNGLGLASAYVYRVVMSPAAPNTVYAATDDGVYKSTDGGTNWGNPLSLNQWIWALEIAPNDANTLYAGTNGSGVYKSTDGGSNWTPVNTGLSGDALVVSSIAIDPSAPTTVYAGTGGGVYKSTNAGTSWSPMNTGFPPGAGASELIIDPVMPSRLYAGTSAGVWVYHACGDGNLDTGEQCDDGNETAGDGCSSTCRAEPCYSCNSFGCQPQSGIPCNADNNGCTTDTCVVGTCVAGTPVSCSDGLSCTADTCISTGSSTYTCSPTHPVSPGTCLIGNVCYTDGQANPGDKCERCTSATSQTAWSFANPNNCLDNDPCTSNACNPATGACESSAVTNCAGGAEGYIGGPEHACVNGTRNETAKTCTLAAASGQQLIVPDAAMPDAAANFSIIEKGNCDFQLQKLDAAAAGCFQLEPSGLTFGAPVTAVFHWDNVPDGAGCNPAGNAGTCAVAPATGTGQLYCEQKLQVFGPGGKALTDACHPNACPDTPHQSPICVEPCSGTPTCDPTANTWTLQLTHFSDYAIAALGTKPYDMQCYNMALLSGGRPTGAVNLIDAFGAVTGTPIKGAQMCMPTSVDDQTPEALWHPDHLQKYRVRADQRQSLAQRLPVRDVRVHDRFGTHSVDVVWPTGLLVPTALDVVIDPPVPAAPEIDAFTCYKVWPHRGSERFTRVPMSVNDEFVPAFHTITPVHPIRLCAPADLNGQIAGAEENPWHLMCYRLDRGLPKTNYLVNANNVLGPSDLLSRDAKEVCVPALIE